MNEGAEIKYNEQNDVTTKIKIRESCFNLPEKKKQRKCIKKEKK